MHSVYALCDPRTGDIRYIGQAIDIHKRYAQHLMESTKTPKKAWLEELKRAEKLPALIVLESGLSDQQILEREMHWIAYYLKRGDNLTNIVVPGRAPNSHATHKKIVQQKVLIQPSKPMKTFIAEIAPSTETLISADEAGKILGVTSRTVLKIMGKGELPSYKSGHTRKFKPSEVRQYRDSCRLIPLVAHPDQLPAKGIL